MGWKFNAGQGTITLIPPDPNRLGYLAAATQPPKTAGK
jgi:hypothetical protein